MTSHAEIFLFYTHLIFENLVWIFGKGTGCPKRELIVWAQFNQDIRTLFRLDGATFHTFNMSPPKIDINWPPRNPHLIPIDFLFWGYLKSSVYPSRIDSHCRD